MGATYRGRHSSEFGLAVQTNPTMLPPISLNTIDVPGRPGAYLVGSKYGMRTIPLKISFIADDLRDYESRLRALADWLRPDLGVGEYISDNEPDKVYYAVLSDQDIQRLDNIARIGQGTVTLVAPDPYAYGPTHTQKINDPNDSSANPIITNEGNAETYPIFTANVLQPITFLQIVSPDSYMQAGQPYEVDQEPTDGEKPVLLDEMGTLTGWGPATTVVDGRVQGSFASDGSAFKVNDYGPAYNGWAGPALKKSLPSTLQDFRVHVLFQIKSSITGVGRIEIYGLDTSNDFVFRMAVGDFLANAMKTKAHWDLGPNSDLKFLTYGKKSGELNDYYGLLVIERKGNKWQFYTAKRKGAPDIYVDYVSQTFVDTKNQYTAPLAQIQVHIGSHLNHTPIPLMTINHVFVYDLRDPGSDAIPYIAYPGDVLRFDHKTACIYRNGEPINHLKDFGASFFPIGKGQTELAVNPTDAAIVTVEYQPRWL